MRMLIVAAMAVATKATPPPSSGLSVPTGAHGAGIAVRGVPWFNSGNVSVTVGNTTYSTVDGSLKQAAPPKKDKGSDKLGAFARTTWAWTAGTTPWVTSVRLYASNVMAVFEQTYPAGADRTAAQVQSGNGQHNIEVSSCWPSIDPNPVAGVPRGYVSFEGRAFLEGSRGGAWQDGRSSGGRCQGQCEYKNPGGGAACSRIGADCPSTGNGKGVCTARCSSDASRCSAIGAPCGPSNPGGSSDPGLGTGNGGGPFAVFANPADEVVVISAASEFMTHTHGKAPLHGAKDSSFCFGLDAPVASVPPGYSLETIVYLGTGVNSAVKAFGTELLRYYGTERLTDFTTEYLGFSTDNGAYYYYNTCGGDRNVSDPRCLYPGRYNPPGTGQKTYQDTLLAVHEYAQKEAIPYRHVLLDSWWYTKGAVGGLKEWDATPSTFPDGLKSFADKTGWKFQMHNRMWSDDNVYAKQNGGKYDFIVEPLPPKGDQNPPVGQSGLSIPTSQQLWDDLIVNKTEAGVPMVVYEQDWMYNEWEGLAATRASPTLSRDWLMQMGTGAAKQNVGVQYCMGLARMVMQSVEIPAVTTFRASDDYGPGQTGYFRSAKDPGGTKGCTFPYCVYYVGTTSILAWALQLGPSKDNFWSMPFQPGSAFNRDPHPSQYNDTIEPYNEMQAAISAYTTASVAISDGIGFSNASLIKMTCRSDGRLLHPTAPARAIDMSFALAGGPVPRTAHNHAVMSTFTDVGGAKWSHVLVIGLNSSWSLSPAHLGDDIDPAKEHVVWSGYQAADTAGVGAAVNITVRKLRFSAAAPIVLEACGYADFGLWHAAPVFPASNAAFLGEVGKWVPVSAARVAKVTDAATGLTVDIIGSADEIVKLAFSGGVAGTVVFTTVCRIDSAGTATASFDGNAAKC